MSVLDTLLGIVAPHACMSCGIEGQLLCTNCQKQLRRAPDGCYRCGRSSPGGLTCCSCRGRLTYLRAVATYEGLAKTLVWSLKLNGAQSAARLMAGHMTELVQPGTTMPVIIPVPTATGRRRLRGYDQACLLARALSRQTHLPYREYLVRNGQTHQHGVSREQRLRQLDGAFRVKKVHKIKRARVVLIDDVATTGATLEAAAVTLLAAGAAQVEAIVFARPT